MSARRRGGKKPWRTRERLRLIEWGVALSAMAAAFVWNFCAGMYVNRMGDRMPSLSGDLFLWILPRVDLSVVFIWGFTAFWVFAAVGAFWFERDRLPYLTWMYALLIAVRAFFLVLTPMGAPSDIYPVDGYMLFQHLGRYMTFTHDLFFSAHTSMPFLGFLLFRRPWMRGVFLSLSIILATTVLLTRMHYSIDVFAAYFITYGLVQAHRSILEKPYRKWRERWLANGV